MKNLKLFEAFGIEAEYMIVDQDSLKIQHLTAEVLKEQNNGILIDEVEAGEVSWSNELVDHVIEIKCNGPKPNLKNISLNFYESVKKINKSLKKDNSILMPTAMHPFMNPSTDMQLWPHGQKEIYNKYHEIFSCTGHGWSNLQSVHINLPYKTEDDFSRLHAAIRTVLPFISFLSASSPIVEGQWSEVPDARLKYYEKNQSKVASVIGDVIPEPLFNFSDYQRMLDSIYKDISVYDPEKVLQHQWLNSRGAIVKFDVKAIEIRLMDIQESPYMDFSLIAFIVEWIKALVDESLMSFEAQKNLSTAELKSIYDISNSYKDHLLSDAYTKLYSNISGQNFSLWTKSLYEHLKPKIDSYFHQGIETILNEGNLSKRIKKASDQEEITEIYKLLIGSLNENKSFKL